MENEDLCLVQVLPVRGHFVLEVEAIPVLIRTVLRELAGVDHAVVILHKEAGHLVVRPSPEVTVDPVVGDVWRPGLDHPVVPEVHLPTLPDILPVEDVSLMPPVQVQCDPASEGDLLLLVVGDGDERVPQTLYDDLLSEPVLAAPHVDGDGRVRGGVRPQDSQSLQGKPESLPWLELTAC